MNCQAISARLSLIFHGVLASLRPSPVCPMTLRQPAAGRRRHRIEERYGMRKWECVVCGFIYDEAEGLPEEGIAPGTAWDDVPEDWVCPDCGVGKEDFEMVEI